MFLLIQVHIVHIHHFQQQEEHGWVGLTIWPMWNALRNEKCVAGRNFIGHLYQTYQHLIVFLRAGSSWRRLGNGKHEGRGAELLALCGTSLPCDRGHQPCLVGHCPSDCLGHCPCLMGHCPVCSTLFKCWDTTPSLGHFPYFLGHCPAPRNCPCLLRLRKTDRLAQNCSWLQNYQ